MGSKFFIRMARGDQGTAFSVLRTALRPLSAMVKAGVGLRNRAYDSRFLSEHRVGVPVISIGNLTVGGTGKTPATAFLARALLSRGRKPGIVSRGYKAGGEGELNDENILLCEALPGVPLVQDRDRVNGCARLLAEEDVDCILLDDGFQHRRLHRDLDILLVDASAPDGGGRLLPAGLLREPLAQARRASLVLITRADSIAPEELETLRSNIRNWGFEGPVVTSRMEATSLLGPGGRELDWLDGKIVYLASGVGNPASFRNLAAGLGAEVVGEDVFPDHYRYTRADVVRTSMIAQEAGAVLVLTTVKDWVKIRDFLPDTPPPFIALSIALSIVDGQDSLDELLEGLFYAE